MSKGLLGYPENMRTIVAMRRATNVTRGCGFWAAIDYIDKKGLKRPGMMGAMQAIKESQEKATHDERGYHQPDSDALAGRHPGGGVNREKGGGKQQRRGYKPTSNQRRHTNTPRLVLR